MVGGRMDGWMVPSGQTVSLSVVCCGGVISPTVTLINRPVSVCVCNNRFQSQNSARLNKWPCVLLIELRYDRTISVVQLNVCLYVCRQEEE